MAEEQRKEQLLQQLEFFELLGNGPHSVDIENKNQVSIVQGMLKSVGYYNGEVSGKYDASTEIARGRWLKDIMKDPDFNWAMIKKSAREIFEEE